MERVMYGDNSDVMIDPAQHPQIPLSSSSMSERTFNFSVTHTGSSVEEDEHSSRKMKSARDPLSHRIIEKRRRDRMNTCLADLSKLLPTSYLKQGQGRIEKTEIIEMAIKYINLLQARLHAAAHVQSQVSFEEKLLQGYQECCSDTARYMDQIGYKNSDTMYRNLCSIYDGYINKHKNKINQMYDVLEKNPAEPYVDSASQLNVTSHEPPPAKRPCTTEDIKMTKHTLEVTAPMEYTQQISEPNESSHLPTESGQAMDNKQSYDAPLVMAPDSGLGSGDRSPDTFNGHGQSTSSDCDSKAYKYKDRIHKRFTVNGKVDVSKSGTPDEKEDFKEPLPNSGVDLSDCNSFQNGSTNSNYESSVKSNSSNDSGSSRNTTHTSLSNTVPAFALHPMGVHYIPLVLPVSQVMPFMKNHKSMGICHPVSIPVSFTGPFLMGEPEVDSDQSAMYNGEYMMKGKKVISARSDSDKSYCTLKNRRF